MFSVLVHFSLDSVIVRDVARNPEVAGAYFGNILALRGLLFLITCALISATVSIMDYPYQVRLLLYVLSLGLLFKCCEISCCSLFNALQQMKYSAVMFFAERSLFALLGLVAVSLGGLVMLGVCFIASEAIVQLASLIIIRRELGIKPEHVEYRVCKRLAQQASSFCAISIITVARR